MIQSVRAGQLGADASERQLDRLPPRGLGAFRGAERRRRSLVTLGFALLKLDVLALEASSHTVFYRYASRDRSVDAVAVARCGRQT